MKNAFIIFFLIFGSIILRAQNISVTSFSPLPNDLTANTAGTEVKDQNGEKTALIKVVTTQTGFTFEGGALGITKVKQENGEVWVYIPQKSKKITIKHPRLGVMRDYFFPCTIEAARTYEMKLATGSVKTTVEELVTNQFVVFQIEPKDAIVMLDNELLEVTNGLAQKYVPFGSYDYSVEAGDYHPEVGKVTIDDPDNKTIVTVNLKPAFGWIEIQAEGDMVGAKVYMDNKLLGTAPMRTNNISSGQHRIKILKAMYKPWEDTVTVNDSKTTIVNPSLSADFCEVTFTVENNAEIWINGERKGVGSWSGRLASGDYKLVTKLIHHRDASLTKSISAEDGQLTVVLPVPTPVLGNIMVTTTPALADITIDGKPYGQTPNAIRNILEGEHTVEIRKSGYLAYSTTINVKDGQTVEVGGKLQNSDIEDSSRSSQPSRSFIAKDTESFKETVDMKSVDSMINSAKKYAASKNYMKEEPTNPQAQMSLMDYYRTTGNSAEADTLLYQILENPETEAQTRISLMRQVVADNEQSGGDSTRILNIFSRILSLPQETSDMAEMHVAYMNFKHMPTDSILSGLNRVLAINPENIAARLQRLDIMWRDTIDEKVIAECEKAIDYTPEEPVLYYYLGLAKYLNKDDAGALEALRKGAANIKEDTPMEISSRIYMISGDILHSMNLPEEAYAAYDSCLNINPNEILCLNNYAYYLSEENRDLKRAEQMSYKTIKAEPENVSYLDTYAWILYMQKRYEEARIYIDQALKSDSTQTSSVIFEHAGDIYIRLGLKSDACNYWQKAIDSGSDNATEIKKKIARTKR